MNQNDTQNDSGDGFDDPQPTPGEAIDFLADMPTQDNAEPSTLEELTKLAMRAGELDAEIIEKTTALEVLVGELNGIRRRRIPDVMEVLGMTAYKMADGRELTIDAKVNASITEENKPAAFKWLRANDFDGLIKTGVSLSFGKGEDADAQKAAEFLREKGFEPSVSEGVHPATLKSFVKERLEAGEEIPTVTFGIFEFKEAKIKLPKVAKSRKK